MAHKDKPIVIAYCRGSMVHGDFCHALNMLSMRSVAQGLWIGHQVLTTTLIDAGRNYLVDQARKQASGFSHVLMLDTDMWFPADALERLLSLNLPVVGASYCMRMEPRCMTHRDLDYTSRLPVLGEHPNDVYPVSYLGMGCVLIRADVIDALYEQLHDTPLFQTQFQGRTKHKSEDVTFCENVRRVGFDVHCDVRLSYLVRHVGLYPYSPDDIQANRYGERLEMVASLANQTLVPDAQTADTEVTIHGPEVREWKAYPYGGGQAIPIAAMLASEAAAMVARDFGTVQHIDWEHGFIFYKPKGWNRGES